MNVEEFKELLRMQNLNPNTTHAQREANEHRLKCLEILSREKQPYTPPVFYDAIYEAITNPRGSVTPLSLLSDN